MTNTILAVLVCLAPCLSADVTASNSNAPGTQAKVLVLAYSPGVMGQVMQRHQDARYPGDFVPGIRIAGRKVDGWTAVNYQSRWMVGGNVDVIADVWNPKTRKWVRQRFGAADWQRKQDSTGHTQRLELDYESAERLGFWKYGGTHARIVSYESGFPQSRWHRPPVAVSGGRGWVLNGHMDWQPVMAALAALEREWSGADKQEGV